MATKLTLTIEASIIEKAKKYAKIKGRSLSDMVENYLKVVVSGKAEEENEIAPLTQSLRGTFKKPADFDYKKQLTNRLANKYQ